MKVKNLVVGLRVQVKREHHTAFFSCYAGKLGTIVDIDIPSGLNVRVEFDDGSFDWGNHKGIKRAPVEPTEPEVQEPSTPASVEVGSRVRLKQAEILGFLEGDVGTAKYLDSDGTFAVHFDVARNGWGSPNNDFGIPDLHGLWVDPDDLEVIAD